MAFPSSSWLSLHHRQPVPVHCCCPNWPAVPTLHAWPLRSLLRAHCQRPSYTLPCPPAWKNITQWKPWFLCLFFLSTAFQPLGILVIFVSILGTSNWSHPTYLQLSFQTIKQRHFGFHLEKLKTMMENMQNLIKCCSPVNYINFNFLVVHDHIRCQQWERGWMKGIWRLFFAIFTTLLN